MTKTEMVELIGSYLDFYPKSVKLLPEEEQLFNRHFKDLFDDFKVKLQEQVDQDIEDEEQEYVYEEEYDPNGIMEGE